MGRGVEREFRTGRSVKQCAEIFRSVGEGLNSGLMRTLRNRQAAKAGGEPGFYQPSGDAFSSLDDRPDFEIGVNVFKMKFGRPTANWMEMRVYDEGDSRLVKVEAVGRSSGSTGSMVHALLAQFGEAQ